MQRPPVPRSYTLDMNPGFLNDVVRTLVRHTLNVLRIHKPYSNISMIVRKTIINHFEIMFNCFDSIIYYVKIMIVKALW